MLYCSYTVAWNKYPKHQIGIERVLHRISLQGLGFLKYKQTLFFFLPFPYKPFVPGSIDREPTWKTCTPTSEYCFPAVDRALPSVPNTPPQYFGEAMQVSLRAGRTWPPVFTPRCCRYFLSPSIPAHIKAPWASDNSWLRSCLLHTSMFAVPPYKWNWASKLKTFLHDFQKPLVFIQS